MKLGILSGYSGRNMDLGIEKIQAAEDMGYESVWTAEAYGSDAVTPAAWILANTKKMKVGTAIMQMPARTPACTAMTAMTLNQARLPHGLPYTLTIRNWRMIGSLEPLTRRKSMRQLVGQMHG